MNLSEAAQEKFDRISSLTAIIASAEAELEGILGDQDRETEDVDDKQVASNVRKNKKTRNLPVTCGNCGQTGHTTRTCSDDKKADDDEEDMRSGPADNRGVDYSDLQLAEIITKEWAVEHKSSLQICKEYSCSMSRFNRIIVRYDISRK